MESSTCGHLISRPHSRVIVISPEHLPESLLNLYHQIIIQIGPTLFKKIKVKTYIEFFRTNLVRGSDYLKQQLILLTSK